MLDIAALFRSRQQKFASRTPVAPARTTAPPWPERLILGVHSLEPSANIVPNLPEFLALGRALTEKGLKRQYRTRHSPAVGGSDLVSKSISEHTLPVYTRYSPAESTYYRVFHRDTYLVRNDPEMTAREPAGSTRGTIYELSRKSEARLSHLCKNSGHRIKSQLCLTYHEQNPIDGAEVKKHLSRFLAALRRAIPRVGYLWILEFQKRGVPHFHIFLTAPPDREAQKILSASWVRITAGTEKQYRWHIRPNNWIEWHMQNGNYVAHKYLTKHYQKDVPHQYHSVGRYWGNSRNMVPIPTIIMPEEIASNSYSQQWDSAMVKHYIARAFRRLQERQLNYDRQGNRREGPRRKASITRQCSELTGAFKIANGSKALMQLIHYIRFNSPDEIALNHRQQNLLPF